ncbi:hypothetical protein KIK06_08935 [Nocardiopsis sp. EMB25]|uniref:hypothetical protein n=1 Tax=Nocardiopsis sp. EMB25 TaxID=2835867 RepID=UPI002283E215|nr:hypothetical protein [Nocardiopsis sp. EMB25]MCY9784016.1 hypothetical protein [Nocardiopsis sp. EMB25]
MTDTPQRRGQNPGDQMSAADVQAALAGSAVPEAPPAPPAPRRVPGAPETTAAPDAAPSAEGSAPPGRAELHSTVTPGSAADEALTESALDRPSKPVMAGAAIAGLLLVVSPFAFSAGAQNGAWLQSIPLSAGGALGEGAAQGTAAEPADAVRDAPGGDGSAAGTSGETTGDPGSAPGQETGSDPTAGTGDGAGGEDPGYIPEALPQETDTPAFPEVPDTERNDVPADTPAEAEGDVTSERSEPAPEEPGGDGRPAGDDTEPDQDPAPSGDQEPSGGTDTQDAPAAAEAAGADEAAGGTEPTAAADEDTPGETAPDTSQQPTEDTPGTLADQGGETAEGSATAAEADGGGGSILEDTVEANGAAAPEPYSAITGPGCLSSPGAAYDRAGRWDSAEGTSSWATRPGGYGQEGCGGDYEAVPVSGDASYGDGQYAYWSFTPGHPDATCEIYVFVPDDESPLWVAETEAKYQIFSGPVPEGDAIAVFGVTQSNVRGAWVQVTGFTSPTEQFTVQLTNAGENPLADQEHASSHVAASVMRTTCS